MKLGRSVYLLFTPPSPWTGYLTNFCFLATNYSSWCFSVWIPSYGAQLPLGVPVTPFPCRLETTSLGRSGFLLRGQGRKWVHQLTESGSTFIGPGKASQDWLTVWQEQVPKREQSHSLHLLKGRGTRGAGRHKCAYYRWLAWSGRLTNHCPSPRVGLEWRVNSEEQNQNQEMEHGYEITY